MNYNQLINKEVINKNNQKGVVVSINPQYLVVKYQNEEKTYNPDIAFKSKFITFTDDNLNRLIEGDLSDKAKADNYNQELIEAIHKSVITKNKRILDYFDKISEKNGVLQVLFGGDFLYPPYTNFIKKYYHIIGNRRI